MTSIPAVRATTDQDLDAILALYPRAFEGEELRPIVSEILGGGAAHLSLGAFEGDACVGHVLFSALSTEQETWRGALLAPLGVDPALQRRGLGRALVMAGFDALGALGVRQVLVLGDPAYYSRLGFTAERELHAPYPLPPEYDGAWQSQCLKGHAPLTNGEISYPAPWLKPELW